MSEDGRLARGAETRARVIAATRRVLARDGLARVTHRTVATEADVPLARTTYHFASLTDLLVATHRSIAEENVARLRAVTEVARSGRLRLDEACAAYLADRLGPGIDDYRAIIELRAAATRIEELRPALREATTSFVDLIEVFLPDRDQALTVFAAITGYATLVATESDRGSPDQIHDYLHSLFRHYDITTPEECL